jgi:hypothetical protein
MKYQIEHNNSKTLKDKIFDKMLTAPEAGVYSILNIAGIEVDFKNHLLDSMEQINTWLNNLREHGFIDIDEQNKKITILQ